MKKWICVINLNENNICLMVKGGAEKIDRFFASKCQPFQDDDTPLINELVVARDENIAKE